MVTTLLVVIIGWVVGLCLFTFALMRAAARADARLEEMTERALDEQRSDVPVQHHSVLPISSYQLTATAMRRRDPLLATDIAPGHR